MSDLMELAKKACQVALQHGAQFTDVELNSGRSISINVEKSGIHDSSEKKVTGVSVRSIIKGATGFSHSSGFGVDDVLETAKRSADAAKLAQPDPDFVTLPAPSESQQVSGLYDEKIAQMSAGDLIQLFVKEIDAAREVFPEVKVQGEVRLGLSERVLVNSMGIEIKDRKTGIQFYVFCIVRKGDDVGSFYDFDMARMKEDFDPEGLGAKVCEEAVGFLGSKSIKSARLPVVFGPLVTSRLFHAICASAGAEAIQRKRSYLVGKRGQRIGSELLTLRDDAYIPQGMASGSWDGEGAVRKKVTVVEEGVLVNHLHSCYTAHKAGEKNTGHGNRWGGVAPTNVIPALGTCPASEIISDTKEGIYVNMGSVTPHPVHGEISATIDFGYKIENGQLAYPLRNTMLGINVFDLLNNLDAISSDYREEPGMIMPTIRVQNVKAAGAD
jgi:PmbA protein